MNSRLQIAAGLLGALLLVIVVVAVVVQRGDSQDDPEPSEGAPVILAAGDIAHCDTPYDELTADLLDTLDGTILALGDLAYEDGTTEQFDECYDPTWGRHKSRTMPSPGNHEYSTANATGYFGYFGAAAGDPAKGYYSFDVGTWHVVSLNSNCGDIEGCGEGSVQEQWLREDLQAHPAVCTLAFWHHPRFSSGEHGNNDDVTALFQALYDYGADVVLAGHDHNYERFAPQTPAGEADEDWGIRSWVVGTGGRTLDPVEETKPNSETLDNESYGVLELTLHETGYDYRFVAAEGSDLDDSGSGECHGAELDPDGDGTLNLPDS